MKKVYLLLASLIIAIVLCFSSPFQSIAKADTPDEYVEYVCINGQWYQVVHTDNGDIQMNGIGHPPQNL